MKVKLQLPQENTTTMIGKVIESFQDIAGCIINSKLVTRKGTSTNKALLIELENGQQIVRLESEVEVLKN